MENFFYNDDIFCRDLYELMDELGIEEEELNNLPDDWKVECAGTKEVPFAKIDLPTLRDLIFDGNEDRIPEDSDTVERLLEKALNECVDFKKLAEKMPTIYLTDGSTFTVTKSDLIAWC